MEGVATLFSASFGGYILMLVKDSSSHLSLYEELRNLQADIHWVAKVLKHCLCMEQNYPNIWRCGRYGGGSTFLQDGDVFPYALGTNCAN